MEEKKDFLVNPSDIANRAKTLEHPYQGWHAPGHANFGNSRRQHKRKKKMTSSWRHFHQHNKLQ